MKRMGEMVQHGKQWIITEEGVALQVIEGLRIAIDHALNGNLLDAEARLAWLRVWRKADSIRQANENKSGADLSTNSPEKCLQAAPKVL
jgi:hypothetical protein